MSMSKSLRGYRGGLAAAIVAALFTNASLYLFLDGALPIPPSIVVLILLAASAPLLLGRPAVISALRLPLTAWAALYLFTTIGSAILTGGDAPALEVVSSRALAVLVLVLCVFVFAESAAQEVAQHAIAWAVLLGVALNIYEVIDPAAFSAFLSPIAQHPGRSAALYMNPNASGAALTLGMLLSMPVVRTRWRAGFVLAAGIGVAATLSRGAVLTFGLALLVRAAVGAGQSREPRARSAAALWLLTAVAVWLLVGPGDSRVPEVVGYNRSIARLTESSGVSDRAEVARLGWALFAEHPLLGAGLGSTQVWDNGQSTHNIYLRLAGEQGILGLLLFPILLVAVCWRCPRTHRPLASSIVVFFSLWGLFSHNVLDERPLLVCVALAATIVATARREAPVALELGRSKTVPLPAGM